MGKCLTTLCLTLFIVLDAISVPAVAASDDCATVDFRPMIGPARDQGAAGLGDSGLCFAFTTADLISQKVGYKVSAIDIATTFFFGPSQNLKNLTAPEIQEYLRNHPKFQEDLKIQRAGSDSGRASAAFDPDVILTAKGIYDVGGDDEDAIIMANLKGICPAADLPDTEFGQLVKKTLVLVKKQNRSTEPDYIAQDPASIVTRSGSVILATKFEEQVDLACHRRRGPTLIPVITSGANSLDQFNIKYRRGSPERKAMEEKLFATINWALSHGHMVGVDYNSDFIMPKDEENDHASSVVARKKFGRECRYLIRNSFGPTCGENVLPEFRDRGLCQDGNIWVTRAQLSEPGDLYSVTYLK